MNYIHLMPYVISALYFGTFTSWFGMLDSRYEEYNEDRDMYKHLPAVYLRICMQFADSIMNPVVMFVQVIRLVVLFMSWSWI